MIAPAIIRKIAFLAVSLLLIVQWSAAQESSGIELPEETDQETIYTPKTDPKDEAVIGESVTPAPASSFMTSVGSWLLVITAFAITAVYLKRKGFFQAKTGSVNGRKLEILETTALGGRQFLVLARIRNREVLLGVGQGFISRLETIDNVKDPSNDFSFENELSKEFEEGEES